MPNKWCVLFYWLLVCLDIPGEFILVDTRVCKSVVLLKVKKYAKTSEVLKIFESDS